MSLIIFICVPGVNLPIFLGLIFLIYKKKEHIINLALIFFCILFVLVFLTGERSAFFYSIITFISIFIFINKFKIIKIFCVLVSFMTIYFIVLLLYDSIRLLYYNICTYINMLLLCIIMSYHIPIILSYYLILDFWYIRI